MKAVFVDIETTGLDFDIHVIVEFAMVCVDLCTNEEVFAYSSCMTLDADDWRKADPKALDVNGFSYPIPYQTKKDWEVGKEIEALLVMHNIKKGQAFFMCQNPSFDRPFFLQLMCQQRIDELEMPYHWLDLASMYWIKVLSPQLSYEGFKYASMSKDCIAHSLGLPPEEKPHRAMNGVRHLISCYEQLKIL